ncbi:unnamed protein product [Alternaria alternata]
MEQEAITTANKTNSPLLRLPGEILNRIYELAFCGKNTTRNALLKTCKQIEYEAKPIYYSNLTVSFGHQWNVPRMIKRVEPEMLNKITSACSSAVILFGRFQYTKSLPGLKYRHIYPETTAPQPRAKIVDFIRKRLDRDVEVTFGPSD